MVYWFIDSRIQWAYHNSNSTVYNKATSFPQANKMTSHKGQVTESETYLWNSENFVKICFNILYQIK